MKPKYLLTEESLNQFKTNDQLIDNSQQVQMGSIEKISECEYSGNFGNEEQKKIKTNNSENNCSANHIHANIRKSKTAVPCDRNATFNPMTISCKNIVEDVENVIVSLFAKGMNSIDIQRQIQEIFNIEISARTISLIIGDIVTY